MLFNTKDARKFFISNSGHVNARESFYILNNQSKNKQNYYIHINTSKITKSDGQNSILEVNASLNPSRMIAKIFESSDTKTNPHTIKSGDIVRILHVDSGCYI